MLLSVIAIHYLLLHSGGRSQAISTGKYSIISLLRSLRQHLLFHLHFIFLVSDIIFSAKCANHPPRSITQKYDSPVCCVLSFSLCPGVAVEFCGLFSLYDSVSGNELGQPLRGYFWPVRLMDFKSSYLVFLLAKTDLLSI